MMTTIVLMVDAFVLGVLGLLMTQVKTVGPDNEDTGSAWGLSTFFSGLSLITALQAVISAYAN